MPEGMLVSTRLPDLCPHHRITSCHGWFKWAWLALVGRGDCTGSIWGGGVTVQGVSGGGGGDCTGSVWGGSDCTGSVWGGGR